MRYYIELENGLPKIGSIVIKTMEEPDYPVLDITKSVIKCCPGSGKEIVQDRWFIKTTIVGEPLSGTLTNVRPTSGKYIDITRDYLEQANIDPYLLDEDALYA